MTLIVGMNFGAYALLAADTRVSFFRNGQWSFRDDALTAVWPSTHSFEHPDDPSSAGT
jgi:hypothetical protein